MTRDNTGAEARAAAARIVDAVAGQGHSLDDAIAAYEGPFQPADRSLLRMLSYGGLRNHWSLGHIIDRLLDRPLKKRDRIVQSLLAVGLFQLTDTRIPEHAAVSATVEAARLLKRPKHAGLLNAILRRYMRERDRLAIGDDIEARYNHPAWFIDTLRHDWPNDWEAILAANNDRAPMWLRVNRQRGDVEAYRERLSREGIEATRLPGFDDALRLAEPVPVSVLPGFDDGDVSVQDAAAQIAAPWLLDGRRGRILDACAAPGGKSAHLKEIAANSIDLTCIDIDPDRAARISETLRRLGLDATVRVGDASNPGEAGESATWDGILVDAPCSGTGVIRRHPDIKLLRRASDRDDLQRLQTGILSSCWASLVPGGRLLFVTCSVLVAENDGVIGPFLDANGDARENDMLPNNNIRDVMRRTACGYQVMPGTAGLDGFYFACLEKVA